MDEKLGRGSGRGVVEIDQGVEMEVGVNQKKWGLLCIQEATKDRQRG